MVINHNEHVDRINKVKYPCGICKKAVATNHHAIQCDSCHTWIHIKCNKLNKKDYREYQRNPDKSFVCINCLADVVPFTTMNNNQFNLAVTKGINFLCDADVNFSPSATEQQFFDRLNHAININAFDINNDDAQDNDDLSTIDCKYYDVEGFDSLKLNPDKVFSVLHLNIHSIELHIEEFRVILELLNFKFDFLCITESKIQKDSEPKVDISIDGYQSPVGMPTESTKGGVLIYAKSGINIIPRDDLTNSMYRSLELESFFVEVINTKGPNSIVGVIYRHPCMAENIFIEDHLKILNDKLSNENKQCYISGDYNFDLLNVSTHNETFNFFDTMMSSFLLPTITLPTKINSVKSSVIDNIFTNHLHPDMKAGNLTVSISDHLPSFLIVPKHNQNHLPKKQNLYSRDMKKFDRENFILDYLSINWIDELEVVKENVNNSITKFMTKMNSLLDKYLPLKKVTKKEFKRRYKPWISNEILHKIDQKNNAFKKYINCKNAIRKATLKNEYMQLKYETTFLTRNAKKNFYKKYFTENKNNLQKIWKGIKEVVNIKSKNFEQPSCISNKDEAVTDPTKIANAFNGYFSTIAEDILNKRKFTGTKSFTDYLTNPLCNSFVFRECNELEIRSIITSLGVNKAAGPNSIPTNILHLLKDEICSPLSMIFNISLSTGQHPDLLKVAKTIPVFKKGSRLLVSNYRPICLLSNINKILEKLVFSRVYKFLDDFKCIYPLQFGFRAKHSTNHALIDITENIRHALDNKQVACGIFVDLQKAFDTVNHNILLQKLNHYGIRGLANDWFSSYLSNRTQFVSILGFDSDPKCIKHGVPQGSVLGPLLFLIYINDLNRAIKYSKVYHFADDTNLLNINNSPKKLQKQVNIDLKLLYHWLLANKISLNCSKTELIFFKKPGDTSPAFRYKIRMNGHKLLPSDFIKYLGIYLDSHLSGKHHSNILITKLKRSNGMLSKARHYIPQEELRSLYYAIFSSHLVYGCQVWGQNSNTFTDKVFRLQNRSMRIISFSDFHAEALPLYKANNILTLKDFISLQNCLFVHDFLNNKLPSCFQNYFKAVDVVHGKGTKSQQLGCLFVPHFSTKKYGLASITRKCINSWNNFSRIFNCSLKTMSRFVLKSKITKYFIDSY